MVDSHPARKKLLIVWHSRAFEGMTLGRNRFDLRRKAGESPAGSRSTTHKLNQMVPIDSHRSFVGCRFGSWECVSGCVDVWMSHTFLSSTQDCHLMARTKLVCPNTNRPRGKQESTCFGAPAGKGTAHIHNSIGQFWTFHIVGTLNLQH